MRDRDETRRYLENWQDEVDSATDYRAMAASETDPRLARVYANLAEMEEAHIAFWEDRLWKAGASVPPRRPSWRSRVLGGIARRFGPELVLPTIAAEEEEEAGFRTPSHFTTVFRRVLGLTPGAYRTAALRADRTGAEGGTR